LNYIVLICARGGSKGIPKKNEKLLGGIPLIGWSILCAKKLKNIAQVIVSTDSKDIADLSIKYGAKVPFIRPSSLAKDNSPEWLVWRHAVDYLDSLYDYDGLIVIPPTAPLRSVDDIKNCIEKFENSDFDIIITVSEANRSPFFNMVKIDKDGNTSLVNETNHEISRRQDAPPVYDMTTVAYVVKPSLIKQKNNMFQGKVGCVQIPPERSLDIDTKLDFKIAEYLIKEREL
jgi:CMP-N-acetylneuraminic acid synthetase